MSEPEQDRPMRVWVAEALGCRPIPLSADGQLPPSWGCGCDPEERECESVEFFAGRVILKRYDTDWSATGPLIERYKIELTPPGPPENEPDWGATTWGPTGNARGATPLEAVCHLLVALAEAGKLPR